VTRQTVSDDARAEARLNNQQLSDKLWLIDKGSIIAFIASFLSVGERFGRPFAIHFL
jgi:hypothetical protein